MVRIAVVDDDAAFLSYMTDALSDQGWEVLTCSDSLNAPTLLRSALPDLIILDVRMSTPDSGWEICSFLQIYPTTQGIPIIICSAATDLVREKETWLRDHKIATLEKPFDLDAMYALVRATLASVPPVSHAPAISIA